MNIEEIKELITDPEFKFLLRANLLNMIAQSKVSTAKKEVDTIKLALKGSGIDIKNFKELIEPVYLMGEILLDADVKGACFPDIDTTEVEKYINDFKLEVEK